MKTLKRGTVRKKEAEFVGVWLPLPLITLLDQAVRMRDSDRSKLIRNAVRKELEGTK